MGNSRARGRCSSVVGVLVAAVCLVTTAGVSAPLAGAAARSGPGASGPAPVPTFPGVKAQIVGLVDMGSQAPYSANEPFPTVDTAEVAPDATAFHGITVNIAWSQLEPEPGKFVYTDLTNSLNAVTKYNKAHPKDQLVVKLRVFGAYAAPQWAKTLDGPAINTVSSSGVAVTDGQWWQPDYEADWANLQDALAARYDTNQLIHSVAVDSCTSLTQEPFNMAADSSVLQQIQADGWTDQKQENCLIGALSDYSKWTHTSIDYAFNPFKYVQPGKDSFTSDTAITNTVMADCADSHASGGPVCILSNHGLDPAATEPSKSDSDVYSEIDTLWSKNPTTTPIDFQADTPAEGCPAITVAVAHHAQSVELWPKAGYPGYSAYSEATLDGWDTALVDGSGPDC
jgi:hypothetical protein